MILVQLFDGTTYPVLEKSRIAFGKENIFLKSLSTEGEEVLVTLKHGEIEFISEI